MQTVLRRLRSSRSVGHGATPQQWAEALYAELGWGLVNRAALRRAAVASRSGCIYNRIEKNANSSLIILFHWLETGQKAGAIGARKRMPHLLDWPTSQMQDLAEMRRMVVVRNPFSRTLSAFLNKVETQKFRRDVGHMERTPEDFRAFVKLLDEGHLSTNSHWDLQMRQLVFTIEAYTDVLRFENLEHDLSDFLLRLDLDQNAMHRSSAFQKGRTHRTDANAQLERFYDSDAEAIVRRLFSDDFEAFGYSKVLSP